MQTSREEAQSTFKLVATNLIANGKIWEGSAFESTPVLLIRWLSTVTRPLLSVYFIFYAVCAWLLERSAPSFLISISEES